MPNSQATIEASKKLCCAASEMITAFAQREPVKFDNMIKSIGKRSLHYADYQHQLKHLTKDQSITELGKTLRRYRVEQQVVLACKDILGQISIEKLLISLSGLASACLDVTYHYLYEQLAARHGVPLSQMGQQQHLSIFGMGKLGGNELNFSSDIDLILAYPAKGETQGNAHGEKIIDNELFFHRLAQRLIRLLDQYDEYGFVYRVDMRLKPFGSVGTLCTTFSAMKRYYLEHGRNWERYALVKMRAVAGDISAGNALVDDLTPFIYQRHVDYDAMQSIEEMKQKLIANNQEKNLQDNLKLGQGGIREIEFLVQTFQMIYGGRLNELRGQSLLIALAALKEKELLSERVANMLRSNYLRLRKIENAIQYFRDQQTHELPNKATPRQALLTALGISDWLKLVNEVARIRFEVYQLFKRVFAAKDDKATQVDQRKLNEDYWLELIYQTDITRDGAESIARHFVQFYRRMHNHDLGDRYIIRLNWILPQVIKTLDGQENPVKIAKHMLRLLEAIADESVYLSLLVEHPSVLRKIMHLFMHSSWMTRFLCQHPRVIDELIHENYEVATPGPEQIRNELQLAISQSVGAEAIIPKLMDFKNASMFRVASADLQNKIRLMHVSDQLTWTAEAIIEEVLALCYDEMTTKYGHPTYTLSDKQYFADFGIIAYGKLGGLEMGYGSDLDLVFLHSSQGEDGVTDGKRSIDNDVFFTRLVGKFNNYITTLTPSGKLYEIDIRLRPSGHSGLLVHSLRAFENYQKNKAWTWEHQALVRARFIAGGQTIQSGFTAIRRETIEKYREVDSLRDSVLDMREKMYQAFSKRPPPGFVHVKHERGGVTDIEFIVQYLLLKHTHNYPLLIRCSDNMRQIAALELFEIIRSSDATELRNAYRAFRYWIHHQQLLGQRAIAPLEKYELMMSRVRDIWDKIFTTKPL